MNFLIYWDGDLERELLDGTMISKINSQKKIDYIFSAEGCSSNNSTKSTPCLSADILGDWREEVIFKTTDSKYLRVYCTPYTTDVRLTTLMHDAQYREQVASQQTAYNQPPHTSFFLGTGYALPERPAVTIMSGGNGIADGKLITGLNVNDKNNRYNWSVQQGLDNGDAVFGDRAFMFTSVPEQLRGAEWIRSACDSKKYTGDEAKFTAGADITLFVGLDSRVSVTPDWLSGYTKTAMTLTDDGNPVVTYNIYMNDYKSGEEIILGKLANSSVVNYVVIAKEYDPNAFKEPVEFIPGDINNDKLVNIFDMIFMRRALIQPLTDEREKLAADLNGDGVIGLSDAVMLQNFLLGLK
mgnify:FL=1